MEIAPWGQVCRVYNYLLYLIKYAHNDLIRNLDLLRIPDASFNTRACRFDTNVAVNVTIDISYIICYIHGCVIIHATEF